MKSLIKETVVADAPENHKNCIDDLKENLSITEIEKITLTIKNDYPEIYQYYAQTELIALLALNVWYKNQQQEWSSVHSRYQNELDRFGNFMEEYPQLQEKGLEIELELKKKIQDNNEAQHKGNTDYVKILRSLQNCLTYEINKIISNQKELKKNNKATKAAELADPFLKDKKTEHLKLLSLQIKEMKPLLKKIEEKMSIENIREIIESKTKLKFYCSRWQEFMEYKDDDISISISENVIVRSETGRKNLGLLHHFKLDDLLMEIDKKYWLANQREMQIESIFAD
jgi:hypothetical protein